MSKLSIAWLTAYLKGKAEVSIVRIGSAPENF